MPGVAALGDGKSAVGSTETREMLGVPHGMVAGLSVDTRTGGMCRVVAASGLVGAGVVAEARVDNAGSGLVASGGCRLLMAGVGYRLKASSGTAGDGMVIEVLCSMVDDRVAMETFGNTAGDGVVMKVSGSTVSDDVVIEAFSSTVDVVVMEVLGTFVNDGVVKEALGSTAGDDVVMKALDGIAGDGVVKCCHPSIGMDGNMAEVVTGDSMAGSVMTGEAANESVVGAAVGSKVDIPCDDVEVDGKDGVKEDERG